MKAEKSESSRLSRRNISVAGRAAHSVMAFILIVSACSSLSRFASKVSQGTSFAMFQRAASRDLNRSGYSIVRTLVFGITRYYDGRALQRLYMSLLRRPFRGVF